MVAREIQEPLSGTKHTNFTGAGIVPISYHGGVAGLPPANDVILYEYMVACQVQKPQAVAVAERPDLGFSVAIPIPHHRNVAGLSPSDNLRGS